LTKKQSQYAERAEGDKDANVECDENCMPALTTCTVRRVVVSRQLVWRIPSIGSGNKSGALEFSVPELDPDVFFPLQISFESAQTLSGIQVEAVVQAGEDASAGAEVAFHADTRMSVEKYTVE
jgi:hypothetical protein